MNYQETIIQLNELKLHGMASAYESIMTLPVQNRPTLDNAVARLVEAEAASRREKKTQLYIKKKPPQIHGLHRGRYLRNGSQPHQERSGSRGGLQLYNAPREPAHTG